MSSESKEVTRRAALVSGAGLILGAAGIAHAGVPKVPKGNQSNNGTNGPYGLPPIKKVAEACMLSHDEEQAVLRVYDDYKHKEHEEMQAKDKSASSGGRSDCIAAVKAVMTPDEQKRFDELLGESGKKKKKA